MDFESLSMHKPTARSRYLVLSIYIKFHLRFLIHWASNHISFRLFIFVFGAELLGCKLKILRALEKKFVPPLGGLLFETIFGKYIVSPTFRKKFSTRNPAVFFKINLECAKRMNTKQVTSERRKPEVSYG